MSSTPIFMTPELKAALQANKINPYFYGPAYGGESACLDLYYATPTDQLYTNLVLNKDTPNIMIPTGLHIALPKDRVALILERGSVSKTPLKVRAGVIDAGYTGQIFINCLAIDGQLAILPYQKLPFQLLVTSAFNQFHTLTPEEWEAYLLSSARRDGCVGSSDIKV